MSSYIGVQVPDEPIGSGDDEGAHDQDYLQEYRFDQAPRPVTTRSRRGDASTLLALLGEPETEDESPVAASSAGPLPTVTFASPGVRTEQSQADTTSNQPRAATSLSQEYRGSPEQDRSKLGVERQPGDRSQSLPSVGTTAKTDDGTNSGDRAVNVEQQSTGKTLFAYLLQAKMFRMQTMQWSRIGLAKKWY
ncbi:hypothetical protein GLAREA_03457 [Glarea lozoyensis ATCC 20868]|uniref:Uncharacterized protein n=1 Tax=Glarea lozoyensis (strain ATCC 20868 / MF5171) TaxID=1116229 RepID=S3CY03_GLAL2|nr:uncharacterized protein GLAREA_03457 [Glarea lozoyensis ATCC 20868]EPE30490.1 hypothetical protein GLAREA_03457 [Glarea lozoyensis ATCC 20868]